MATEKIYNVHRLDAIADELVDRRKSPTGRLGIECTVVNCDRRMFRLVPWLVVVTDHGTVLRVPFECPNGHEDFVETTL